MTTHRRISYVEAGGLRIRAAVRGHGRPLLLIAGAGGNIEMWEPFEQALEGASIETITFDAPGTGQSSGWTIPRRMGAIARVAEGILDALGYDQVDALGASLGGAVGIRFI